MAFVNLSAPVNSSNFNPFPTPFTENEAEADVAFLSIVTDVPALINNPIFIATLGCTDGDQNITCTDACSNVTSVFENWSNFYTCSWYPELSEALSDTSTTGTGAQSLGAFGIYEGQNDLSSNTSITIATCLSDYCKSSSICLGLDTTNSCSMETLIRSNASYSTLDRANAFECVKYSVCGSIVDVNPDIGGLGVILSLLIQYSIPIFAMNLHYYFYIRHSAHRKKIHRTVALENVRATLLKTKKKYEDHLAALTSALVEFQKAQCFFAVTLQIAALIVIPQYLSTSQGKNQILLRLTAANGFSPIVLTLAYIDFLGGRNSWYLLFLSSVTFILATATYWSTSPQLTGGPINWTTTYENPATVLPSCGNVSPFAPCFVRNQFQDYNMWPKFQGVPDYLLPSTVGLVVWVICLGIFLYRTTYKICHARDNWKRISKHLTSVRTEFKASLNTLILRIRSSKHGERVLQLCGRVFAILRLPQFFAHATKILGKSQSWDYIQLTLGYFSLLAQLTSVLIVLISSNNLIATQMSFGQIVAVGIWVPVFLEYAYLEINGAEEGTEYRLKAPLVVSQPASGSVKGSGTVSVNSPVPTSAAASP